MKKIALLFTIVSISFIQKTKAQVPDTLAYLQNIVANKSQYVGQPFSVLYNNLQIQVKHFWPNTSIHYAKNKEISTQFAYYFPLSQEDIYLTYPCIEIYWQTPLNANQSGLLWGNNNGGGWSTAVYNFYKNAIIADIKVRE